MAAINETGGRIARFDCSHRPKGGPQHTPTAPGTDAAINLEGWISVTPMRADLTAHDVLPALEAALA